MPVVSLVGSLLFRLGAALLVLAVLTGCGGERAAPPPPAVVETTNSPGLTPELFDAYIWVDTFRPGAPVMRFGESLHVGADVAPPARALAPSGARGGAALSRGHVRDAVSASDVVDYLRVAASHKLSPRSITGLGTYPATRVTVLRLVEGPYTRDTRTRFALFAQDAVGIINTALPFGRQIRFSPHLESQDNPDKTISEIKLHFLPKTHHLYPEDANPAALGMASVSYYVKDQDAPAWEITKEGAGYSTVFIDPEAIAPFTDAEATHVLVHELLHAMGFTSHTDPARHDSTLNPTYFPGTQPRALIHPVDRAGLLAAYSRFAPGAKPGEISAETLGPWSERSFHLRGDLDVGAGMLSFGVAFANGLPQPWATGPTPSRTLRDNPAISGSVTWRGALVGVTTAGGGVLGDASLTLDTGDFLGRLDLSAMRFESGAVWEDGDLSYAIRADGSGYTFRRADTEFRQGSAGNETSYSWRGNDLGSVTGVFLGPGHEGMAGVLERHDLSAAFGGRR